MFHTTFDGQTLYVIDDAPSWKSGFVTEFNAITDTQTSLTRLEGRRPYSMFLRLSSLKYAMVIENAALKQFQGEMRALKDGKVCIPFWPAIEYWQDKDVGSISGGLLLVYKPDWSQWELYLAGNEPAWPVNGDLVVPCVVGYLKANTPNLYHADAASWAIQFVESSPAKYALLVPPDSSLTGPQPTGYTNAPTIIPFGPDWKDITEDLSVAVKRDQISMGREVESTFYPHDVFKVHSSSNTFEGAGPGILMSWFNDIASQGNSFWAVGGMASAQLRLAATDTDTVLTLTHEGAVLVGDYIAAFFPDMRFAKITAVDDVLHTITLDATLGVDLPAGQHLFPLCLARIDKPKLQMTWLSPALAKAKITWVEVRAEKVVPAAETIATTLGKLPTRIAIFEFTRDFRNGTQKKWYYTSAEIDIDFNGQTWLAGAFSVGDTTTGLNLENDSADISSFIFEGNPLLDEIKMTSEGVLQVAIKFLEWSGTEWSAVIPIFFGDCGQVSREGSKLRARCRFGPTVFDTQVPRMIRGSMCNHVGGSNDGTFLISAGCTLLKSAWKFTGLVANPISSSFPYTLKLSSLTGIGADAIASLAGSKVFLNWFANGWIEIYSGELVQRRMIIGSTLPVAGVLELTLHKYLTGLPVVGDTVTLFPGCDGLYETCKAYNSATNPTGKFNNKPNFGGEPFTPTSNPSTVGQPNLNTQGGKK
jgi:hypothetical protein